MKQHITLSSFYKRKSYQLPVEPYCFKPATSTASENDLESDCKSKRKNECSKICNPFLGLIYTIFASTFLSLSSVFVKQLYYVSPGQLAQLRYIVVFFGSLPIAVYSVKDVFGRKKDLVPLILRGLICATAFYLYVIAFKYLPLAEGAIILSTVPALTAVVARLYLKESIGIVQGVALVITLCGTLTSIRLHNLLSEETRAELDTSYVGGLFAALACVCIQCMNVIVVRKMKNIHFSVFSIYIGLCGVLENTVINFFTTDYELPRSDWDRLRFMLMGLFGFLGSNAVILAVRSELAAISTAMRAGMDIIVAMLFQFIFFSVSPDLYTIIGSFLVIFALFIIGCRKWILTLPEESSIRKKFMLVL